MGVFDHDGGGNRTSQGPFTSRISRSPSYCVYWSALSSLSPIAASLRWFW